MGARRNCRDDAGPRLRARRELDARRDDNDHQFPRRGHVGRARGREPLLRQLPPRGERAGHAAHRAAPGRAPGAAARAPRRGPDLRRAEPAPRPRVHLRERQAARRRRPRGRLGRERDAPLRGRRLRRRRGDAGARAAPAHGPPRRVDAPVAAPRQRAVVERAGLPHGPRRRRVPQVPRQRRALGRRDRRRRRRDARQGPLRPPRARGGHVPGRLAPRAPLAVEDAERARRRVGEARRERLRGGRRRRRRRRPRGPLHRARVQVLRRQPRVVGHVGRLRAEPAQGADAVHARRRGRGLGRAGLARRAPRGLLRLRAHVPPHAVAALKC
mmetsp:Transcript_18289/g.59273  ORF Transcript_18289/g.59273 Transcript_18289/m.59273 type:complete len:328 (+) Transcript_18289:3-986(+)